ncbi:ZIP family zinc transporter [Rubrivivax gelatinosus]|uniref:ZIP family metal transporter n=1 Tax=Rubrivivax gelatinosus TaxID=28068 RepID=UPI0018CB459D|nr:ZIP family metal transporter [Rubrivivax gelatinosus]MBG6081361.1 ZIP family zinc transporter [Rubrivivax gelatinosus]
MNPTGTHATLRPLQWLGLALCAAGAAIVLAQAWRALVLAPAVAHAGALGAAAALATALGVLPLVLARTPSQRTQDTLLGFGAGVMLAATCFSLLNPALDAVRAAGFAPWPRAAGIGLALLAGAGGLMLLEHLLPHSHALGGDARPRRVLLFVLAIVLHNIPEGLAIGVAAVGSEAARATALTGGIAIQDVPEGLVVALALHAAGMGRGRAALLGAASGLVEPLAAVLGAAAVAGAAVLLPWALAFAAGAMLFVVSHEVIPESHRQGHERQATAGLMLGFVLMMVLDTALA